MSSKPAQDSREVKAAKAAKEAARAEAEAERTVPVRAVRVGFYPAEGRIRIPGAADGSDYFDYVRVVDSVSHELEVELPSWMEDTTGTFKSREEGVPRVRPPRAK